MEWIVIASKIAAELLTGIRRAASLLTGAKRRLFQAEIATEYCNASPRQTESWFGFNRHTVKHSKYNAIERCWGALEKHWNGTLLTTIPIVLKWAQSMTWKGIRPIVRTLGWSL